MSKSAKSAHNSDHSIPVNLLLDTRPRLVFLSGFLERIPSFVWYARLNRACYTTEPDATDCARGTRRTSRIYRGWAQYTRNRDGPPSMLAVAARGLHEVIEAGHGRRLAHAPFYDCDLAQLELRAGQSGPGLNLVDQRNRADRTVR